jgi:hypothetical protein
MIARTVRLRRAITGTAAGRKFAAPTCRRSPHNNPAGNFALPCREHISQPESFYRNHCDGA